MPVTSAAALLVALSPLTLGQAARIEVYAPLAQVMSAASGA